VFVRGWSISINALKTQFELFLQLLHRRDASELRPNFAMNRIIRTQHFFHRAQNRFPFTEGIRQAPPRMSTEHFDGIFTVPSDFSC
jgi:hypothetical protein